MIEAYRLQPWYISRVGHRMSQQVAIRHVLYPASGLPFTETSLQHAAALRMIHRVHRMWFNRAKELIVNKLWLPGDAETRHGHLLTYRRILHCRPSCVFFRKGNLHKIRPCNRNKICPFCAARAASFAYRRLKSSIRQARGTKGRPIVTCRVLSKHVTAAHFCPSNGLSADQAVANMRQLKDIFDQHKAQYSKLAKQLQRKTSGSSCRFVVAPTETGWTIEIRQLFLARTGAQLPRMEDCAAKVVYSKSAKVEDDEKLEAHLGRFLAYPSGLLTSYSELVAVYLNALHCERLTTGTGVFRACGRGLTRVFKQEEANGRIQLQHRSEIGQALRPDDDQGET
jgi:hypothetical protein